MKSQSFLIVLAACLVISYGLDRSAVAQTATSEQEEPAQKPDPTTAKDAQAKDAKPKADATPGAKYGAGDDVWTRKYLTGDWDGLRSEWGTHGFSFDLHPPGRISCWPCSACA